jgi:phosphoribosylformimino-5-aminoimidazole carboxamide ribotide isomerase
MQRRDSIERCDDSQDSALRTSHSAIQIIPVLDLLNGVVVRGVGGRRDEYRPVESVLSPSAQPLDVARAFRERLKLTTLYVADLDGILRQQPNIEIHRQLAKDGFELWIDAGVRSLSDASRLLNAGAAKIIVGLETIPDARLLAELATEFKASRIVFSLDLQAGHPLLGHSNWPNRSPLGIAQTVFSLGLTQLIVLDLASVGEQRGPSTLDLCESIRRFAPDVRLITGGGVRNADDLQPLQAAGIDGVLLATALHNGAINVAQLPAIRSRSTQFARP